MGMILDHSLSFDDNVEKVSAKVSRGIAVKRKLQYVLPRETLIVITP